jgi:hypothetical protein
LSSDEEEADNGEHGGEEAPLVAYGPKKRLLINEIGHANEIPLRERKRNGKRRGKTNIHYIADEVERNKAKSQRRSTMFKKVIFFFMPLLPLRLPFTF